VNAFQLQPLLRPTFEGHVCRLCQKPITPFTAKVHMSKDHGEVKYQEVDGRVYLS